MSKVVVTKSKLDAINSAISAKTGMSSQRTLDGMATAIGSISGESGALAQYRALTSGTATALEDPTITELVDYAFYRRTNLKKISLPNLTFMGREAFRYCSSLTGFIDCPAPYGQGNGSYFRGALTKTCVLNINCMPVYTLNSCGASHLWLTGYIASCNNFFATDCANLISIQFENVDMIKGDMLEGAVLSHMIIRQTRDVTLSFAFQSPTSSTLTVYVPASKLSWYATATNWSVHYNAGLIKGIDEDTLSAKGTKFTPGYSGSGVDHWDKVDLQTYSVDTNNTFDPTDGSLTPTKDGRLLIRGLDSNGGLVYCVYLKIGTGFDEEANAAS